MAGPQRKPVNKKKILPVKKTRVANVDYKDVNLLKKFIAKQPALAEPWTPKLQSISLNYTAQSGTAHLDDERPAAFSDAAVEFFHVDAFGVAREHLWLNRARPWADQGAPSLLPPHPAAGELLIGIAGDVVEVKDGYGRNFLLPQGKAIRWTRGTEKQIDGIKRARDAREVRGVEHAQELRAQLEGLTVSVAARVSEQGHLFGAVTASDVAVAVKKAGGPTIDKRAVSFAKPVKSVGSHTAAVKLHSAVTAHVPFAVVAQ